MAQVESTEQIKGFYYTEEYFPGGAEYFTIPADYKLGDVIKTDWPIDYGPSGPIYGVLIDAQGNYYGITADGWTVKGTVFQTKYSSEYTDAKGNTYTFDPRHAPGEVVSNAEGKTLIDAQDNYYGYDSAGNWVVLGQLAYGTKTYEELGDAQYVLEHTGSYDKLLDQVPGVEVNSVGFAGAGGLQPGILDRFDNTDGCQLITNPDQLQDILEPGKVVPPVFADRDALYGGAGQDVLFGDHVFYNGLDGIPALIKAIHAMDPNWDTSTNAGIHQFLVEHPGFVDTLQDPNTASDQADLLVGGSGDDILAGQGGNDALFGDGGADKASDHSADAIHDLLGAYDKGADLFTGVHDLIEHGRAGEIDAFLKGIEGNAEDVKHPGLESDHDGNDHLFGGSGDDMLFGMGGDDKLFGGDGSDALFGGSGDDFLDGGNDTAVDYLYGGSGNDILLYDPNDVIDGGSGTDVLLVGSNEDMDLLFAGGMDKVSDVELIIVGKIKCLFISTDLHYRIRRSIDNHRSCIDFFLTKFLDDFCSTGTLIANHTHAL